MSPEVLKFYAVFEIILRKNLDQKKEFSMPETFFLQKLMAERGFPT